MASGRGRARRAAENGLLVWRETYVWSDDRPYTQQSTSKYQRSVVHVDLIIYFMIAETRQLKTTEEESVSKSQNPQQP